MGRAHTSPTGARDGSPGQGRAGVQSPDHMQEGPSVAAPPGLLRNKRCWSPSWSHSGSKLTEGKGGKALWPHLSTEAPDLG